MQIDWKLNNELTGMTFFILTYIFVMAAKKMNFYPIPTYIFAMAAKKLNFYGLIFLLWQPKN